MIWKGIDILRFGDEGIGLESSEVLTDANPRPPDSQTYARFRLRGIALPGTFPHTGPPQWEVLALRSHVVT